MVNKSYALVRKQRLSSYLWSRTLKINIGSVAERIVRTLPPAWGPSHVPCPKTTARTKISFYLSYGALRIILIYRGRSQEQVPGNTSPFQTLPVATPGIGEDNHLLTLLSHLYFESGPSAPSQNSSGAPILAAGSREYADQIQTVVPKPRRYRQEGA